MLRTNRLSCMAWNDAGKHLRSQVGSCNHGQVPVTWRSPSFGAVDRKNVAAHDWRTPASPLQGHTRP